MRPVELKKDIWWVGAVDWDARDFHGYSLSPLGTTYNAFLIMDEKITLFDTVKYEDRDEFFCNLTSVVGDLEKIDYIVVNHLELDHAGALAEAVKRIKPEKIICSPMGKRAMDSIFHPGDDWPVETYKSGTSVNIGKRNIHFLETRMLHWPDNMVSYIPEEKMLICSDAFGQNWATSERFADEVDRHVLEKVAKEYYANIVQPYAPVVLKTLNQIAEMGIEIDMLVPDHGLIWRGKEDVQYILDKYREFAEAKPKPKAVVVYDTMWHSTEKMGSAIADGIKAEGIDVRLMNVKKNHHSAVMTELFDCGALVVGSPTHNNGILPYMASTMQYIKGLRPENKVGGAFGSFGWSGECVNVLTEWLEKAGIEVVEGQVKVKNVPDHDAYKECFEYGRKIAQRLKEKIAEFE